MHQPACRLSGGPDGAASGSYGAIGGRLNLAAATMQQSPVAVRSITANPTTTNNRVYDDYGSIGGGGGNVVGIDDGDSTNQTFRHCEWWP